MIETGQQVAADVHRPLPEGWRWVRLGDVCALAGRSIDPQVYPTEVFAHYSIPAFDNGQTPSLDAGAQILSNKLLFPKGSVLFSKLNPRISRVWNVSDEQPHRRICSTEFLPLAVNESVTDPRYLTYALQEPGLIHGLRARVAAATKSRERLNPETVLDTQIPLPPLSQQHRIVAILHEQMGAVERARAAAEAQLEAARTLPAAYLRAAFESDEAREWPRAQLQEVVQLLPSKSIATYSDTQVLAVTTACLAESGFEPSGVKTARMWRRDASDSTLIAGEVLVARSNTSELVGRAAMYAGVPENVVASDLTIRLLAYSQHVVSSPFLSAFLSWLFLTGYWRERAGGASGSMKKITRTQIMQLELPLPSSEVQQRIAVMLSEQMAGADRTRRALEDQLDAINQLPAVLLQQAYTGEL